MEAGDAPLEAAGLPLHVTELGVADPTAPSFVLLHGYGGSSYTWRYWAPKLAERGRVLCLDLKGFGSAPKPDDGRYGTTELADIVVALLGRRGLERVTLVGHSMGGGVALLSALRLLDVGDRRIERLVLVSSAAYPQPMPPFVRLARYPRVSALLLRLVGPRRVVRGVIRSIVHDRSVVSAEMVDAYASALETPEGVRAALATARGIVPERMKELTGRFREIDVPTLVLWGDRDRVVPLWVGQRLADELPSAELVVLEGCGHMPPEEIPDRSWQAVEGFLDRTDQINRSAASRSAR